MENQQNTTPILSEERVKELMEVFQQHETEKGKGVTKVENFPTLLKLSGFTISNQKVIDNLRTFYVPEEQLYWMEFINVISFLTVVRNDFGTLDTGKTGKLQHAQIQAFLKAEGFEFNEKVCKACSIVADRELSGSFDFTGAVGLIIYIQFVMVHFNQADTSGDGKLQFDEIKSKFGYLGVGNVSETEARKFFDEADSDKSGEIDPEEFVELVIRIRFPEKYNQFA